MVEKGTTDRNAMPRSNGIVPGHRTLPGDRLFLYGVYLSIAGLRVTARVRHGDRMREGKTLLQCDLKM